MIIEHIKSYMNLGALKKTWQSATLMTAFNLRPMAQDRESKSFPQHLSSAYDKDVNMQYSKT